MSKTDLLFHAGHRERLKEKFLSDKLTDCEQLELLLTYSIPRCDVRVLARKLIEIYGGIYYVLRAPFEDLVKISGVGRNTAILLKLFQSLDMISYSERTKSEVFLNDEKFLREYCRRLSIGKKVEETHVLFLDGDMRLISDEIHSRGTIDETPIYIREICSRALALNATAVLLVHNHPCSENLFSEADAAVTDMLGYALTSISVNLIDHMLVTRSGLVHSYAASNLALSSSFFRNKRNI